MNTRRALTLAAIMGLAFGSTATADAAGTDTPRPAALGAQAGDAIPGNDAQAAEYYREEAAALQRKAAQHRAQAKVFANRAGPKVDSRQLARHCENLAASYDKAAEEAAALADALSR